MVISMLLLAIFAFATVRGWDSGPTECSTKTCSGGTSATVALKYTSLKYDLWTPIHRRADCPYGLKNDGYVCRSGGKKSINAPSSLARPPVGYQNRLYHSGISITSYPKESTEAACKAGFVNMGKFCLRGARTGGFTCPKDHYCDKNRGRCFRRCDGGLVNAGESCVPQVLGKSFMSCKKNELKYNTYCFPKNQNCPKGYRIWGSRCTRCYVNCPSGWFRSDEATCSFRLRWRGNTHLWIAHEAIKLLKTSKDGIKAYNFMMQKDCREKWEAAMYDASEYKSKASSLSAHEHYFNAYGKDYFGLIARSKTYADNDTKNPKSAYGVINTYLNRIDSTRCKALGSALHYVIDMTNPAHTSGFGPKQNPQGLVAALEAYVPTIQAKYRAKGTWEWRWKHFGPLPIVKEIAKRSNQRYAQSLFSSLLKRGPVCAMKPPYCYQTYTGYCFVNDAKVKANLGEILQDAYHSVASWIYSICHVRNFQWETK